MEEERETVVAIEHLNFAFSTSDGRKKYILHDINLQVQKGSRNGAGKSTLLRILAGRHLTEDRKSAKVLGQPAFYQTLADICAGEMMSDLQEEFKQRRDELQAILGVDLSWKLYVLSCLSR
ncbi:hypothetical protein BASA81_000917 [Batrachochytrium salamandrivorans]|nr:hypothetical protein BASA81_000917 [Batrachochytrium salamandrivorans]